MNWELQDVQVGFRKGRRTRDQIANIRSITKKAREYRKNIYFCSIDYAKAFDCVDHNKWKILKRWGYQTTWPASWELCMQVKKQDLELNIDWFMELEHTLEHGTIDWLLLGKEYVNTAYCHPVYLT